MDGGAVAREVLSHFGCGSNPERWHCVPFRSRDTPFFKNGTELGCRAMGIIKGGWRLRLGGGLNFVPGTVRGARSGSRAGNTVPDGARDRLATRNFRERTRNSATLVARGLAKGSCWRAGSYGESCAAARREKTPQVARIQVARNIASGRGRHCISRGEMPAVATRASSRR